MDVICLDFPQYVSKILDRLSRLVGETGGASPRATTAPASHRVVVAACMSQVLLTETPVESACVETAIKNLLAIYDDEVPLTRTLSVDGLAASFHRPESKVRKN